MMKGIKYFVVSIVIIMELIYSAHATPGTATYYEKYIPSACYGSSDMGTMIGAASDALWKNGAVCGKYFRVKCTGPTNPGPHPCIEGKTVTVKIVDHCPSCNGVIDLSVEAFTTIANRVAGKVQIDYQEL